MARSRLAESLPTHLQVALAFALASMLSGCSFFGLGSNDEATSTEQSGALVEPLGHGTVDWVVDGDTVDLTIDGQEERVRLIGIDAPESVSRNDPIQCFGAEASDALSALLPVGTTVLISRDGEARDRYGRLLLYLTRQSDDLFINQHLIEAGFADVMFFAPNTTYEVDFTAARNTSRSAGIGLWGACDGPDQPLD